MGVPEGLGDDVMNWTDMASLRRGIAAEQERRVMLAIELKLFSEVDPVTMRRWAVTHPGGACGGDQAPSALLNPRPANGTKGNVLDASAWWETTGAHSDDR